MKKHLSFILAYFVVMGLSLLFSNYILGIEYATEHFLNALFVFLIILSIMVIVYGFWNRYDLSIKTKVKTKSFFYFFSLIPFIPLFILGLMTATTTFNFSKDYFTVLLGALLIGVAEEGAFRGILLGGVSKAIKPLYAVLISAGMFALLHMLNILGGLPLNDAILQTVTTIPIGLFLSVFYLYTRNIIFPILFHALWDYVVLSNVYDLFKYASEVLAFVEYSMYVVTIILLLKLIKVKPLGLNSEEKFANK